MLAWNRRLDKASMSIIGRRMRAKIVVHLRLVKRLAADEQVVRVSPKKGRLTGAGHDLILRPEDQ